MQVYLKNRALLRHRIIAAIDHIRGYYDFIDASHVAVIGYDFGGLGALDVARAGISISGVASFYGNLTPPPKRKTEATVYAKVLAFTGSDDPMAPKEAVEMFQKEMKTRSADWQLIIYGNTEHGFSLPGANTKGKEVYSYNSDKRSMVALIRFLREIFNEEDLDTQTISPSEK